MTTIRPATEADLPTILAIYNDAVVNTAAIWNDDIVDLDNLAASLNQKSDAPSCEDVQWRFLGVSMAGYNLLASAGLFALTLFAALSETRAAKRTRRPA